MESEARPPTPPATDTRRRVPGPRVLLVGLLCVIAVTAFVVTRIVQTSGPGPDPRTIPERPGTEAPAAGIWFVPVRLAPVLADSSLRGVVLDGEREVLEPGLVAWRIADEPQRWLVEHTWFYIPVTPVRLHTYAEMKALDERGVISDTTGVGMVSYRWTLRASSLEKARREALRQIPKPPPPAVTDAVTPRPRTS